MYSKKELQLFANVIILIPYYALTILYSETDL